MKIFYDLFDCAEDVFREYSVSDENQKGIEFIYAEYGYYDYSGDSFVAFIRDGKLYEVNGSHCSCYGLEDCWSPEETFAEALLDRPNVPAMAKENLKKYFNK